MLLYSDVLLNFSYDFVYSSLQYCSLISFSTFDCSVLKSLSGYETGSDSVLRYIPKGILDSRFLTPPMRSLVCFHSKRSTYLKNLFISWPRKWVFFTKKYDIQNDCVLKLSKGFLKIQLQNDYPFLKLKTDIYAETARPILSNPRKPKY